MTDRRRRLEALVRDTVDKTTAEAPCRPARLPNGAEAAVCVHGALYLQRLIGGVVMGYSHDDHPTALLGEAEGGHNFLLVDDRYVVDLWGHDYDGRVLTGVVDRLDPADVGLIAHLYGDASSWELVAP